MVGEWVLCWYLHRGICHAQPYKCWGWIWLRCWLSGVCKCLREQMRCGMISDQHGSTWIIQCVWCVMLWNRNIYIYYRLDVVWSQSACWTLDAWHTFRQFRQHQTSQVWNKRFFCMDLCQTSVGYGWASLAPNTVPYLALINLLRHAPCWRQR